ncbi:hypothetical protein NDU88_006588 [Pleurodeles waltl]|uniref:Uncharacterized protein n=1 Tax=Pleurodeles waltl TaxID=8319 RepID=A0AAV7TY83_PLEWA|nr:hypothetical protein NDU88_006588 [Pleurodeles waltl]
MDQKGRQPPRCGGPQPAPSTKMRATEGILVLLPSHWAGLEEQGAQDAAQALIGGGGSIAEGASWLPNIPQEPFGRCWRPGKGPNFHMVAAMPPPMARSPDRLLRELVHNDSPVHGSGRMGPADP